MTEERLQEIRVLVQKLQDLVQKPRCVHQWANANIETRPNWETCLLCGANRVA